MTEPELGPMRHTFDWDSERDRQENFDALRNRSFDPEQTTLAAETGTEKPYQLYQSAGGEGYHHIEYGATLSMPRNFEIRAKYGDDPARVQSDQDRWNWGSPYVQTLWDRKYLSPSHSPPFVMDDHKSKLLQQEGVIRPEDIVSSGAVSERLRESRRVKYDGKINYVRVVQVLLDEGPYPSAAALGRELKENGILSAKSPRKTVSAWKTGKRDPADSTIKGLRDALRYRAKKHGIAHYKGEWTGRGYAAREDETDTLKESEKPTPDDLDDPILTGTRRRGFGEIFYVADFYADENEDSHDAVTIRTGFLGHEHDSAGNRIGPDQTRLWQVHNRFTEEIRTILSPKNYEASRMDAGINYEDKVIPEPEANMYLSHMKSKYANAVQRLTNEPEDDIIVQVLMYDDEDFNEVKWFFLGVWPSDPSEGRFPKSVKVLEDNLNWWGSA